MSHWIQVIFSPKIYCSLKNQPSNRLNSGNYEIKLFWIVASFFEIIVPYINTKKKSAFSKKKALSVRGI